MHAKLIQSENKKFSVEAYFNYIGLDGFDPSDLSLESVTTIIRFHLKKFIYRNNELYDAGNLSVSERTVSSLDINELFQNMIAHNGGYCFQHLELLCCVLADIGFKVDRYLGKIILQSRAHWKPETHVNAKTHEMIIVHIDGKRFMIDVGMANMSLRAPLELTEGEAQIGDDYYRLSKNDDLWTLDTRTAGKEWFCMYEFNNFSVSYEDVCNAHKKLVLTEQFIPIRDELFYVGKTNDNKRKHVIFNKSTSHGFFKSVTANSENEPKLKEFTKIDDAMEFAKTKFGMV